jgi:hypothetical protein
VNVDVVGVAVSANRVEGQNNIRLEFADVFDDFPGDFIQRMGDLRIGMLVVGRAGHAGIAVIEEKDVFQAEMLRGAAEFTFAQFSDAVEALHVLRVNFADFAARGADEINVTTFLGVERQCAAHAKGFVVGVGEYR